MFFQERSDSFGVMFAAFSLPMKAERSRNKERLEASLAGLCELELLKQRQESRVQSALCLGDSPLTGRQPWEALRSVRCAVDEPNGHKLQAGSVQCTPWAIRSPLEKQVEELQVCNEVKSAESTDLEDSQLSAGEVLVGRHIETSELNYHAAIPHSPLAPERIQETKTETEEKWLSDPTQQTVVALRKMRDVNPSQQDCQLAEKIEAYIFGLIQRRTPPTRSSKPRTSLPHDTQVVNVVRQSSLCQKDEQHLPKQVSVAEISDPAPSQCSEGTASQVGHNLDKEHYLRTRLTEDSPPHYHHLQQSVQHQPGLYHKTRKASMVNTSCLTSLDYSSCRVLHANTDSSSSEPNSPQHFHNFSSPPVPSKPHQTSYDEMLVSADYIPAQPCRTSTRAYAHHHSSPHKASGVLKPYRSTYSPERGHHQEQLLTATQIQPPRSRGGPKKCRSHEDRNGASRKPGKKACRSQSESSLQKVPERKYNTVERDTGGSGSGGRGSCSSQSRSKKQQLGSSSYRRWQSTLELSQDEADRPPSQTLMQNSLASNQRDHCLRRTRKSRPILASYAYTHHSHNHHQHMEFQLEMDQMQLCQSSGNYPLPRQCESESSMSEADTRDSSSLSSDSDESGVLVWPQQLPPQLYLPSPPASPGAPLQTKAFVKIKASHALKKKILRFRTGSLKVMTTV